MKTQIVLYASLFLMLLLFHNAAYAQLANSYPNDAGIQNDPNVVYVEMFDDGMTNILSRYNDKLNTAGMSLDADVPAGSLGPNSIKMTSVTGGVNNGGHLYKKFTPGFDTIYVRYYVKYPSSSGGYFHHESVWFGGYNPTTTYPNPQAGTCGLGNSRMSIAYEPVFQNTNPPGMDTYIYWGDMKSWNGGSSCYGNAMITEGDTGYGQPPVTGTYPTVAFDQWMCVEVMLKLNNPVTSYNGELAVWVNGVQAGHWGPGFPNGHWLKDKWYNNPADPPFQGFRWRTNANLNINWLWIEFYHDNPSAPSSYIKYDHLVMARKYIGPISTATGIINASDVSPVIQMYPNPFSESTTVDLSGIKRSASDDMSFHLYNLLGKEVMTYSNVPGDKLLLEKKGLASGVYFYKVMLNQQYAGSGKLIVQ